jgi:hypothetical protein
MTAYYVYPLTRQEFEGFSDAFPNLSQRNEEFHVIDDRFYGWLDPEDYENRRRIVLTPEEDEVFILARTGRADWDFVRWIARNEIPMAPPIQIYMW